MAGSGDLVAIWEIKLSDGVHNIEFEHGTTSGKRVVRVNGKVTSVHESQANLACYESCLLLREQRHIISPTCVSGLCARGAKLHMFYTALAVNMFD